MFYVILFVLLIIIFLVLLYYGVLWSFARSNSPHYHIGSIKSFLGYDFKGEYNIIEFHSKGFHPDLPVRISISLSDNDFDQMNMYLQTLELKTTETRPGDGEVSYKVSWGKKRNIYTKSHQASYVDSGNTFFIATLEIDCDNNILQFSEAGF